MIKLSEHNHRLLYSIQVDWPERELVMPELSLLDWKYTSGFKQRARVEVHDKNSTALVHTNYLKKIVDDVRDQQFNLLDYLYSNKEFSQHIWPGTTLGQLKNNVDTVCELYRDEPGWTTGIHIDHRASLATGMLFFEEENDPAMGTSFYTTEDFRKELKMSTKYGQGWYSANTHRSWHSGGNQGNRYRYSLLFGLFLKLPA